MPTPDRVVVELGEWRQAVVPGLSLSAADRSAVAQMNDESSRRLEIEELKDGVRVKATSWVGVVRLERLEVRIEPKLAGGRDVLVSLIELTSGLAGLWRPRGPDATLESEGAGLLDLIALLFALETERVIRRGLLAGYIEREEAIPLLKGRLLVREQVLHRPKRWDRIHCRFDEHDRDIPENRVLAATVRLLTNRVGDTAVRRRLTRLRSVLDPISWPTAFDWKAAQRDVIYQRLNQHYRPAHELAWLLWQGLGVDDLLGAGRTTSVAFLIDKNVLFERLVSLLLERLLQPEGCRVQSQAVQGAVVVDARTGKTYSSLIPDVLVSRAGVPAARLAIDAKYKLYDERKIDSADLYQLFMYAYSVSSPSPLKLGTALIVYPASAGGGKGVDISVQPMSGASGAKVTSIGIPLDKTVRALCQGDLDDPGLSRLRELALHYLNNESPAANSPLVAIA